MALNNLLGQGLGVLDEGLRGVEEVGSGSLLQLGMEGIMTARGRCGESAERNWAAGEVGSGDNVPRGSCGLEDEGASLGNVSQPFARRVIGPGWWSSRRESWWRCVVTSGLVGALPTLWC